MRRLIATALVLVASALAAQEPDRAANEAKLRAELDQLRGQIDTIKKRLQQDTGVHAELDRDLRAQDRRVAVSAGELLNAQALIESLQVQGVELDLEREQVDRDLLLARDQLRGLLRSAFAAGQWVPLKLWLDQERFVDATRALGYHQYLKQRQLDQLARIRGLAQRKQELAAALLQQQVDAEQALQLQADSQLALEAERAERAKHLLAAQAQMGQSKAQLEQLNKDQNELLKLLEQLSNLIADVPINPAQSRPFSEGRGQLVWPTKGKVTQSFGRVGSDGRPSAGIRISGEEGSAIVAVGHGRVAFADWLRGQGLLVIVDHGDGYMSLYGNCETVIRGEGDWIEAGDQIGTVGRSGGAAQAGLHFELRRGRQAIDPIPWLQRR